jgi:hypothetical protein
VASVAAAAIIAMTNERAQTFIQSILAKFLVETDCQHAVHVQVAGDGVVLEKPQWWIVGVCRLRSEKDESERDKSRQNSGNEHTTVDS